MRSQAKNQIINLQDESIKQAEELEAIKQAEELEANKQAEELEANKKITNKQVKEAKSLKASSPVTESHLSAFQADMLKISGEYTISQKSFAKNASNSIGNLIKNSLYEKYMTI